MYDSHKVKNVYQNLNTFQQRKINHLIQREQGTGNREQEKLMFKNMRLK
jgi:hypothetical protein